jgi:hypothetical protein
MPTLLTEAFHTGGFLVSEARGHRSRDVGAFGGGVKILAGQVLGFLPSSVVAAWPGNAEQVDNNTGNGTLTLNGTPVAAGAQLGVYSAVAASATVFAVTDPYGNSLGNATVGSTFSNQVAFEIAAGETLFVAGDEFSIDVEAVSGVYKPLSLTASDGTQNAAGISFGFVDATLNDVPGTVVTRECEVNGSELLWPTGATAAQIAAATAQLTALGIITR